MHSLFQRTKPFKKKGNKFNFYYIQCQGNEAGSETLFSIPAEFSQEINFQNSFSNI